MPDIGTSMEAYEIFFMQVSVIVPDVFIHGHLGNIQLDLDFFLETLKSSGFFFSFFIFSVCSFNLFKI